MRKLLCFMIATLLLLTRPLLNKLERLKVKYGILDTDGKENTL